VNGAVIADAAGESEIALTWLSEAAYRARTSAMAYLTYVLRDRCNSEPAVKVRDPTASSGR
jgi:hypothetical protein